MMQLKGYKGSKAPSTGYGHFAVSTCFDTFQEQPHDASTVVGLACLHKLRSDSSLWQLILVVMLASGVVRDHEWVKHMWSDG